MQRMAADNPKEPEKHSEVARILCTQILQRRGLRLEEMEEIFCAWARDPSVLDAETDAGKRVFRQMLHALGGGGARAVFEAMRLARLVFERMNPGMHDPLNEHEELIFGLALRVLEAGLAVFCPEGSVTEQLAAFCAQFSILHNYFADAGLFVRKDTHGWVPRPAFMRAVYLRFTGDKDARRGAAQRLVGGAATYYETGGYKLTPEYSLGHVSAELRALRLPCAWVMFLFEARSALVNLPGASSAPHEGWVRACLQNFYELILDAARRNHLPARVWWLQSQSRSVVEELERMGVFEGDEAKRDVPEADLVPLAASARAVLLAKMEGRWRGDAPASEGPLEDFTLAVHAELGPDCEICLSAPKQVVFEKCAHAFMCEGCFSGGYDRKGECPVCKTVSGTAYLLPKPPAFSE